MVGEDFAEGLIQFLVVYFCAFRMKAGVPTDRGERDFLRHSGDGGFEPVQKASLCRFGLQ
jgi:hypothetical protein